MFEAIELLDALAFVFISAGVMAGAFSICVMEQRNEDASE